MQWGEVDLIASAVPAVLSGVALAVLTLTARRVIALARRFDTLADSQRNQLKAHIVEIYERSRRRGYVTPMELEAANRMADSYFELGGNHYVKAVMRRLNDEVETRGDAIPYG